MEERADGGLMAVTSTNEVVAAGLVLLVQHNASTRRGFRRALEAAGYEVLEAADCRTAVGVVARRRPDLVVQDLLVPDAAGLELARSLRGEAGARPVPILCVTGFLQSLEATLAATG